jgi:hypothetical protein
MAGEDPATIVSGDWRRWSDFRSAEVADGPFSEFVTGKQLEVLLPQEMYPTFPGQWKATCQRPITLRSKAVCMRMVFSGYTGDRSKLSEKDKECLAPGSDLWVDIPISKTKKALTKEINGTVNLRDLLSTTYPDALCMHELASESVRATGKYPLSSIVRTALEDLEEDTDEPLSLDSPPLPKPSAAAAKGNRIIVGKVVMSTHIGQTAPRITLKSALRFRTAPVLAHKINTVNNPERPQLSEAKSQEFPQETMELVDNHVGYKPSNIQQARLHVTWPLWKAAMEKEVAGLLKRETWTTVHQSQVPAHVKIMGSQFIFKDKLSGAKARLVVRGDQQSPKPTKDKTFSPTPLATEFHILCALATSRNQPIHSCDIAQAFTQSHPLTPGQELYVFPPVGYGHAPG